MKIEFEFGPDKLTPRFPNRIWNSPNGFPGLGEEYKDFLEIRAEFWNRIKAAGGDTRLLVDEKWAHSIHASWPCLVKKTGYGDMVYVDPGYHLSYYPEPRLRIYRNGRYRSCKRITPVTVQRMMAAATEILMGDY